MQLVQTVTVGSGGAGTIEFASIPGDATDLVVLLNHRGSASGTFWVQMQLNSTSNAPNRNLNGSGTTITSQNNNSHGITWVDSDSPTANTFHSTAIYIPNYTSSSNKSCSIETVLEANSSTRFHTLSVIISNVYPVTSAVTNIKLICDFNLFAQNTTASLYKITKA